MRWYCPICRKPQTESAAEAATKPPRPRWPASKSPEEEEERASFGTGGGGWLCDACIASGVGEPGREADAEEIRRTAMWSK